MTRERTNFYLFGQIFAGLAGVLTIVLIILSFILGILGGGVGFLSWLLSGGFGLANTLWLIIALVSGILLLIIAIGSSFGNTSSFLIGLLTIILGIFQPGLSLILAIIAGIMFIIDAIA
jgi:hypothetical protein